MTKVIIQNRPTGSYNGAEWPAVGESIDLPEHVAAGMLANGDVALPKAKAPKVEAAVAAPVAETAAVKTTPRKR